MTAFIEVKQKTLQNRGNYHSIEESLRHFSDLRRRDIKPLNGRIRI